MNRRAPGDEVLSEPGQRSACVSDELCDKGQQSMPVHECGMGHAPGTWRESEGR